MERLLPTDPQIPVAIERRIAKEPPSTRDEVAQVVVEMLETGETLPILGTQGRAREILESIFDGSDESLQALRSRPVTVQLHIASAKAKRQIYVETTDEMVERLRDEDPILRDHALHIGSGVSRDGYFKAWSPLTKAIVGGSRYKRAIGLLETLYDRDESYAGEGITSRKGNPLVNRSKAWLRKGEGQALPTKGHTSPQPVTKRNQQQMTSSGKANSNPAAMEDRSSSRQDHAGTNHHQAEQKTQRQHKRSHQKQHQNTNQNRRRRPHPYQYDVSQLAGVDFVRLARICSSSGYVLGGRPTSRVPGRDLLAGQKRWVALSDEYVERFTSSCDRLGVEHYGIDETTRATLDEVRRAFLKRCSFPRLTREEVERRLADEQLEGEVDSEQMRQALLGDPIFREKVDQVWGAWERLRAGDPSMGFDKGGRQYTPEVQVKRWMRPMIRIDGEAAVEVDMHGMFVLSIILLFSEGAERETLIEWVQTGKFYHLFADLAGRDLGSIDMSEFKKVFQRDVVFTYRPYYAHLWQTFVDNFPRTARRMAAIRDQDGVPREERRMAGFWRNGRRINREYLARTFPGQTALSRLLTRIESEVFQAALVRLWREYGIASCRIHDCLMVAKSEGETVKRIIEEEAHRVLGFLPKCKISDRSE